MINCRQFACFFLIYALLHLGLNLARGASGNDPGMVYIPGDKFEPFDTSAKSAKEKPEKKPTVFIGSFLLDVYPITNRDYLKFVKGRAEWRKTKVKRIFADTHYLQGWASDLNIGNLNLKSPVTQVSWFAATAYCASINKDLPTTNQLEFALLDSGRSQNEIKQKILAWYGEPNRQKLPLVGADGPNGYGVHDLAALVWEWTQDFGSFLSTSDSRENGKDGNLFCGNGSQLGNAADYAAFMRYSFRASLKANYTTANLGFRCAKEVKNETK